MKLYNDQKLDNIWVSEGHSALDVNFLFIFQSSYNSSPEILYLLSLV